MKITVDRTMNVLAAIGTVLSIVSIPLIVYIVIEIWRALQ